MNSTVPFFNEWKGGSRGIMQTMRSFHFTNLKCNYTTCVGITILNQSPLSGRNCVEFS